MPFVKVRVKPGGKVELEYEGFPNSTCNAANNELLDKLRNRGIDITTESEIPKEDELLQEEELFE